MIITPLAKKGGAGKSTVSILLHEALRTAGKSVTIRDWDAQGTSNKALEMIYGKADDTNGRQAQITIYDTPPNLAHIATATAVRSAQIVLVVTSPSPADIWEAEEAIQFARSKNPKALVRVMLNKVRKTTVLGKHIEESIKDLSVPPLPSVLSARECYQHAIAQGWKALDGAARAETLQLALRLFSLT
jgi:chromosome partitioning protein